MRLKTTFLLSLLLLPFSSLEVNSQIFFRIRADFMIKAKSPDGKQQLTSGKVYYDKNINQIVYEITFPEKETWVQRDTVLYKIINEEVKDKQHIPSLIAFTIYNLVLNGNLSDYGLKKSKFKIINVEKSEGGIISTWEPPAELKKFFGNVQLLNVNQQLNGIVFKNNSGEIVSRQFFRNYINVKGLSFPQEIVRENHIDGQIAYELTTYSKILINDIGNENKYNYQIPKGR